MTVIHAKKGDETTTFTEHQWKNLMPKDHYGWKVYVPEKEEAKSKTTKDKVEEGGDDDAPVVVLSSDGNTRDAVIWIKSVSDITAINAYIHGDTRSTVTKAAEKRIKEIEASGEGPDLEEVKTEEAAETVKVEVKK